MPNDLNFPPQEAQDIPQLRRKKFRSRGRDRKKRPSEFGIGHPTPIDRNGKAKFLAAVSALRHAATQAADGSKITMHFVEVFRVMLYIFHNCHTGVCFPSIERIAKEARVAMSTVQLAIAALEAHGIITWVHRIIRRKKKVEGLIPGGAEVVHVERTSNGYSFNLSRFFSNTENRYGTKNQVSKNRYKECVPQPAQASLKLEEALSRLKGAIDGDIKPKPA
jgi:hypothetical protein